MRAHLAVLAAGTLAACTTNSAVQTGETASVPTAAQIASYQVAPPLSVNPYIRKLPPPKSARNGCSLSVEKHNGALVVDAVHPDEVYCVRVAPLSDTTIELPAGSRLQTASSAMMRYLTIQSTNTVERDILLITSLCVPPHKDDKGELEPADLHEFISQAALPYCPRWTADMTVVMSTGVIEFRLYLNSSTHDARVILNEGALTPRPVGMPVKPTSAETLVATPIGDESIPWTPDDAWADATQTVVVWHRPVPILPAMMMGPDGEQRAAPMVANSCRIGGAGGAVPRDAVRAAHRRPHCAVQRAEQAKAVHPACGELANA